MLPSSFAASITSVVLVLTLFVLTPSVYAQTPTTASDVPQQSLVDRTFTTINYQYRSGSTRIDFRESPLEPNASGQAEVESRRGVLEIEAAFRGLRPARTTSTTNNYRSSALPRFVITWSSRESIRR